MNLHSQRRVRFVVVYQVVDCLRRLKSSLQLFIKNSARALARVNYWLETQFLEGNTKSQTYNINLLYCSNNCCVRNSASENRTKQ